MQNGRRMWLRAALVTVAGPRCIDRVPGPPDCGSLGTTCRHHDRGAVDTANGFEPGERQLWTADRDAAAVVVTVTGTQPLSAGFVTLFLCDQSMPRASNLNYLAGRTVADVAITPIAADGTICLYTSSTTRLIVDINAAFT